MAYMNQFIACSLSLSNVLISFISFLIILINELNRDKYQNSYNLRGTKEKLLKSYSNYFFEKEKEIPLELRKLSSSQFRLFFIYISTAMAFFSIVFAVSNFIKKDKCNNAFKCNNNNRRSDNGCCCIGIIVIDNGHNNQNNSSNIDANACAQGAIIIAIIFFVLIIFVGLFYIIKSCGRHISRLFSAITLIALYIFLGTIFFISGLETYKIVTILLCFAGVICNLLGILLPCCVYKLTSEYDLKKKLAHYKRILKKRAKYKREK